MRIYWKRTDRGVVSSVEEQTEQADALARISGQDRLVDPRTNPAVRRHADALRDGQHRRILDADNDRVHRRIRVEDRRAGHAELALEALHEAREASSPAKSVRALYTGRRRYMHVSLATSIILAFGSARGLEHLAHENNIPAGSGYIAEVGLTGLTTIVILARSELAQHGGRLTRLQDSVLWTLMVAPLVASMAANVIGANVIGAVCAAGAAAFALFSYIVADAFATSARQQAKKVTGDDEDDLRRVASGEDLFSAPADAPTAVATVDDHPVVTAEAMDTGAGELTAGAHSAEPTLVATPELTPVTTSEPTPEPTREPTREHNAREHNSSGHSEPTAQPEPTPVATGDLKTEPSKAEPTAVTTPKAAAAETNGKSKRRTRDQIRAELERALKEHYDNGGGEPQVKPLAEQINANRRIVRELLDEMNVRPMLRKAVGQ